MAVDVRNLGIAIDGAPIVAGVDLTVGSGERVGLVGSSGSGKSMIAKALLGLLPEGAAVTGGITIGDVPIAGEGRAPRHPAGPGYLVDDRGLAALRGRSVGAVFQNPAASLNPVLTVGQQVGLPLRLHYDLTASERSERVAAMLAKVGLDPAETMGRHPGELSGGQAQRVGIATALITSPRFIIADEPTTALDSITQRRIVDLLVSLVDGTGASMLFITHDFSVLARATTRCYVLDRGHVVESGATADLLASPRTPEAARLVGAARRLTLGGLPVGTDHGADHGADQGGAA